MDGKISTFSRGFLNALPRAEAKESLAFNCRGLAVDLEGAVYVAATDRRCILKITPAGRIQTVLQAAQPWSPTGIAALGESLYVLEYTDSPPGWDADDRKGWLPRVRRILPTGEVITLGTIAGNRNQPVDH